MFSKKKAARLDRAEQSRPAQALQRLAEELEPSAKCRQELEERLRHFANKPVAQAQPVLPAKRFSPKGLLIPGFDENDSARQVGRRILLGGLGLVAALAVALLAWVYFYTPPALSVTAQPPVPVAATPATNTSIEEECQQHNVSGADCLIYLEQESRHVQWPALSQKFNLMQSANGYTLTVQRAYADANNIYIGYELDGVKGGFLNNYRLSLVDGNKEQEIRLGDEGQSVNLEKSSLGLIDCFMDGLPSSAINQSQVHLRWKVIEIDVPKLDPDNPTAQKGAPTYPYTQISANMVFDLNIPFISGQQINLNRQDGGASLQKAIITPSEIRFFLSGVGEIEPDAQLTIDGAKVMNSHKNRQPDGLTILGFDNMIPQDGRPHQFVLNVQPGKLDTWNPITKFNHIMAGGPWSFQFQLP